MFHQFQELICHMFNWQKMYSLVMSLLVITVSLLVVGK